MAFGDAKLCFHLLKSATRAGVKLELLRYDKAAGHRQMVEKLRDKFRALPAKTLVVKLDGSDVVLSPDAGGTAFRDRWAALGGGVVFSAEAALFYHIGANRDDCRWVARHGPAPTVFRFLNSGGYVGLAGALAALCDAALQLTAPFWASKDDQSVYATWHLFAAGQKPSNATAQAPAIKLDHCQDLFGTLSGPPATAHHSLLAVQADGSYRHVLTGSHPVVAHLPGRGKRFADFVEGSTRRLSPAPPKRF